jgi:hypothetical protein
MMSCTRPALFVLLVGLAVASRSWADDTDLQHGVQLPAPLNEVTAEMSYFAERFELVEVSFFESGLFHTPDPRPRVVQEETIQWTFEAKRDLEGAELNKLLANPFPFVRFSRVVDGEETIVDAREQGYRLFHDGRWLGKKGPTLKQGERIRVWMHLGREGSAGLLRNKPAKLSITKDDPRAEQVRAANQ